MLSIGTRIRDKRIVLWGTEYRYEEWGWKYVTKLPFEAERLPRPRFKDDRDRNDINGVVCVYFKGYYSIHPWTYPRCSTYVLRYPHNHYWRRGRYDAKEGLETMVHNISLCSSKRGGLAHTWNSHLDYVSWWHEAMYGYQPSNSHLMQCRSSLLRWEPVRLLLRIRNAVADLCDSCLLQYWSDPAPQNAAARMARRGLFV